MQTIRQAIKGRSGLRFWNRALGIEANRDTPRTRQPLTGVTLWGLFVGAVLLLMGQVAFAHTEGKPLPVPTCSGLPADAFYTGDVSNVTDDTTGLADTGLPSYTTSSALVVPKVGDEDTANSGHSNFRYGKITVPALTAGKLAITVGAGPPKPPTRCCVVRGMPHPWQLGARCIRRPIPTRTVRRKRHGRRLTQRGKWMPTLLRRQPSQRCKPPSARPAPP